MKDAIERMKRTIEAVSETLEAEHRLLADLEIVRAELAKVTSELYEARSHLSGVEALERINEDGYERGIAARDAEISRLTEERNKYRRRKDEAYEERNRVVALIARMTLALGYRAGIGTHEDRPGEDWDPEWRTIICIDLPTGQCSWHVHDSQAHLFDGLPRYRTPWDGHDTPEKYRRVDAARELDGEIARLRSTVELLGDHAGTMHDRLVMGDASDSAEMKEVIAILGGMFEDARDALAAGRDVRSAGFVEEKA